MNREGIIRPAILRCGWSSICVLTIAIQAAPFAVMRTAHAQSAFSKATPPDPNKVLGVDFCVKCHKDAHAVWQATGHATSFETMHRTDRAKQIAENLNLRSIKNSGRCDSCHYLTQSSGGGKAAPTAAVGCESCHGAAANWGLIHHDLGGPDVTRETETPEHRRRRLRFSILAGMRTPQNVYLLAQSCYRCHLVADEELVMTGGHASAVPDFNLVAWSQGKMRHNVIRYGKGVNQPSTPQRRRVMFVAGLIAELEAGLRAVAKAQQKNTYSTAMARRTHAAALKLAELNQLVDVDELDKIDQVYGNVQLRLGRGEPLTEAANEIMKQGFQFAAKRDGTKLAEIDPFISKPEQWK